MNIILKIQKGKTCKQGIHDGCLSQLEILMRLEADAELYYVDYGEGIQAEIRHTPWRDDFILIDELVLKLLKGEHYQFKKNQAKNGASYLISSKGRKYFQRFMICFEYFSSFNEKKKPSHLVELYFRALGIIIQRIEEGGIYKDPEVIFNEFIDEILVQTKTKEFKTQAYRLAARATQNFNSARKYVDGLFDHYSKLNVIRIDQAYGARFASDITAEGARADLQRFFNNRRSNKLFKNWVGYIAKLEYGVDHGYHWHLIIFLDGQKVKHDSYVAHEIGRYWQTTVTENKGLFFNCNAKAFENRRYAYKRIGIGMINHDDVNKRHILVHDVIAYLCKKEQHLKTPTNDRVFSKGEQPRHKSAAGRPRKQILKGN